MTLMTTPTPLSPQTIERLAFIRVLHQQGVDQSRLPEPLNFGCVLTFHDCIELFLLLASEQLRVTVPGKGQGFVEKHFNPINSALGDRELTGRKGVGRITDQRNAFKHANLWPSAQAIEGFRADTEVFLEENTPKVFGIAYEAIDMADLVSDEDARKYLKSASQAWDAGDLTEGMALLSEGLASLYGNSLVSPRQYRSPFAFGEDIKFALTSQQISAVLRQVDHVEGKVNAVARRAGVSGVPQVKPMRWVDQLAEQLAAVTTAVDQMQHALRLLSINIDYREQHRFDHLVPRVSHTLDGGRHVDSPKGYAPSGEDFAFCRRFVVTVALRLAELEAYIAPSSRA